ncbi:MAG: hypothetical protein R3B45_04365 [Bdellovibrionota bacterium]
MIPAEILAKVQNDEKKDEACKVINKPQVRIVVAEDPTFFCGPGDGGMGDRGTGR